MDGEIEYHRKKKMRTGLEGYGSCYLEVCDIEEGNELDFVDMWLDTRIVVEIIGRSFSTLCKKAWCLS